MRDLIWLSTAAQYRFSVSKQHDVSVYYTKFGMTHWVKVTNDEWLNGTIKK